MTKEIIVLFLIIGGIADLLLGMFILLKKWDEETGFSFSIFCFWVGLWTLGIAAFMNTNDLRMAHFWNQEFIFTAGMVPIAFVQFVRAFINRPLTLRNKLLLYLPSILILLGVVIPGIMIKDIVVRDWGKESILGFGYPIYGLYYSIYMVYAFILLITTHLRSNGLFKLRVKYVIFSVFSSFMVAAYFNLFLILLGNYRYIWVGPYGSFILVLAITYTIIKYRLLDIKAAFTYAGLFLIVYAFVLGIPFYAAYQLKSSLLPAFLMFILASTGPLWYRYLQKKAENILLSDQKRYQKVLLQASEGMLEQHDLNKLLKLTAFIIKRTVKLDFAAAYLNDFDNKVFVLKGFRNSQTHFPTDLFAYDHPLIRYMETKRDPFTFDELPDNIRMSLHSPLEVSLIVPSSTKESLLGFLFLGPKQDKTLYTQDDINVFKTLSNQAALAVLNCMFTERAKKDQEVLLNEEKLALIGGMAAGVAHQFRNRLNHFVAISCEIQFAVEDYMELVKTAGYTKENTDKLIASVLDLAKQVYDNSHRSTEVIQGILNLSQLQREGDGLIEFVLSDLIHEAENNIKTKHRISDDKPFPLKIDESCSGLVYANKLRLYESLYNTIDNAYEAIREKADVFLKGAEKDSFVPEITIRLMNNAHVSVIAITDNGIGIKEEHKSKIFAPMFTTKPSSKLSSSGIGAFFVKTVIEKYHKGRVYFESEYTSGSTFYIELPRKSGS